MFSEHSLWYISYARTRASIKKIDIFCHTRTAWQQVEGNLCLFMRLCYHLLFPVKTGKDRGENGGVGKCCLGVCWLEVQLCLTVSLPARKNRPVLGVTHSGILHGVIFITFTKHSRGMHFPAVDTGLGNFCLKNSAGDLRDIPSGGVSLAGSLTCLCLGREIPFGVMLIMKVRHSFSLDDL